MKLALITGRMNIPSSITGNLFLSKIITGVNRILSIHLTEPLGFVVTVLVKILRKATSQLSMN